MTIMFYQYRHQCIGDYAAYDSHAGAAWIFTSVFELNHIPGLMPFSWQVRIYTPGPSGQFGLRQVRYAPSGSNQKASIM